MIKISKESLDAFKKGERLIPASIDNKNIMEDSLLEDVFEGLYHAQDHFENGKRHLIGEISVFEEEDENIETFIEGIVDVKWQYGSNIIRLELLGAQEKEYFSSMADDFAKYYTRIFKEWGDTNVVVKTSQQGNRLYVALYFKCEE